MRIITLYVPKVHCTLVTDIVSTSNMKHTETYIILPLTEWNDRMSICYANSSSIFNLLYEVQPSNEINRTETKCV